jgi:hypothetical protein
MLKEFPVRSMWKLTITPWQTVRSWMPLRCKCSWKGSHNRISSQESNCWVGTQRHSIYSIRTRYLKTQRTVMSICNTTMNKSKRYKISHSSLMLIHLSSLSNEPRELRTFLLVAHLTVTVKIIPLLINQQSQQHLILILDSQHTLVTIMRLLTWGNQEITLRSRTLRSNLISRWCDII